MSDDPLGKPLEPKHSKIRTALKPFLAGMATVIPILATGWIIVLVFKLLHHIGRAIINFVLSGLNALRRATPETAWKIEYFPGDDLLWLFIPLALLFILGLAVTNKPGRRVLSWVDAFLSRIPLLGFIYGTSKQFVDAVRNLGGPRKFKGVAYIEYPSPGCRLIGFVTGNFHDAQTGKDVTSIFIPTSPNPMTGFVIIVDDDKVFDSDMSL